MTARTGPAQRRDRESTGPGPDGGGLGGRATGTSQKTRGPFPQQGWLAGHFQGKQVPALPKTWPAAELAQGDHWAPPLC